MGQWSVVSGQLPEPAVNVGAAISFAPIEFGRVATKG
jgi:hypothetical protein